MQTDSLWAIVLAGGQGKRLAPLVTLIHGDELPKQFAILSGQRSLLQQTLDRIAPLIPPERTLVVVNADQELRARGQLEAYPGVQVVVQPHENGTAAGILLPLAVLEAQAPQAKVAIFPSDHHVPNPAPFLEGIRAAADSTGVCLLGMALPEPEPELGWIVADGTSASRPTLMPVRHFVEKPDDAAAAALHREGALCNSFVIVSSVPALGALVQEQLPEHWAALRAWAARGDLRPRALRRVYDRLMRADFSRAVLEKSRALEVVRVVGSGWSDWGTPARVLSSLKGTVGYRTLLKRIVVGRRRAGMTADSTFPRREQRSPPRAETFLARLGPLSP